VGEIGCGDGVVKIGSIAIGVLLAACLAIFASCDLGESGVPTPEQGKPSVIKGQVLFMPHDRVFFGALGDSCEADGVSYDLRGGTPVVVKDVAGTAVARSELEAGVIVETNLSEPQGCRFAFTVEHVPVSSYYKVEFVDPDGPSVSLSYDELEAAGWFVELDIGW